MKTIPAVLLRPHTFHVPVMGTGFTVDTPAKVAHYGISSVISLVDDVLIEQMREWYCRRRGETYEPIRRGDPDPRARRITAYLNLMDRIVAERVQAVRAAPFDPGSEITRYFEMLPDSLLRRDYARMQGTSDPDEKRRLQETLRARIVPGSIDVNIMTKLDRQPNPGAGEAEALSSDAMAALRGYANSTLRSSIVFSAGMHQRLYSYAAQFSDFLPGPEGVSKKSIILKVSDFRSAEIQGRFLAKRGLWVSEYRIESGLNCGGHAFANKGYLMGPILEEFRANRQSLPARLFEIYAKALSARGLAAVPEVPPVRITVQGGIGTAEEDRMLREYFQMDGTGWGTPFLLVPEVTNVDAPHLEKLAAATEQDVTLSDNSPLNVPFWILRTSRSEALRQQRIASGKPGSPCPKGYLVSDTEFTAQPICRASRAYQKLKIPQLSSNGSPSIQKAALEENVLAKACICHDLAGGATVKLGIDPQATTTVCCGPNIANFSRIATLKEMVDHIYGRISLLTRPERKHMFVQELALYVDYLRRELKKASLGIFGITPQYLQEFRKNLEEGILYYREFAHRLAEEEREKFLRDLADCIQRIRSLDLALATCTP